MSLSNYVWASYHDIFENFRVYTGHLREVRFMLRRRFCFHEFRPDQQPCSDQISSGFTTRLCLLSAFGIFHKNRLSIREIQGLFGERRFLCASMMYSVIHFTKYVRQHEIFIPTLLGYPKET